MVQDYTLWYHIPIITTLFGKPNSLGTTKESALKYESY